MKIRPADASHKANLTIVLTSENQFRSDIKKYFKLRDLNTIRAIAGKNIGATSISATKTGSIKQSIVIIPTDRARAYGRLLTTFAEMLTKSVGMQYQSVDVFPSIFNHRAADRYLTGLDYVMLKLLYDRRIKPGMNSQRIRQLISSIIKEKSYQHHIYGASLSVKQSGLNTLVN